MISNHAQFIAAINERKLIHIVYYSHPDAGTVDRQCAPLDYGPAPEPSDGLNRYWIWDDAATAGANPLGLVSDQIVSVQVLGKVFDPAKLPLGERVWILPRKWGSSPASKAQPKDAEPARA